MVLDDWRAAAVPEFVWLLGFAGVLLKAEFNELREAQTIFLAFS